MNQLIKTCISKTHTSIQTGKFPQYPHPPTTPPAKKKNLIIFNW